jgi:hypothetical protein
VPQQDRIDGPVLVNDDKTMSDDLVNDEMTGVALCAVEAPALAGSRLRAQQILAGLPDDLSGAVVRMQCGSLIAAAASFADEVVRTVLVDRQALRLEVTPGVCPR